MAENSGIGIVFSIWLSVLSPLAIIFGSLYQPLLNLIIPFAYLLIGIVILFSVYSKTNKRMTKARIFTKVNLEIIGCTLISVGLVWLIIQWIFYSSLGVFLGIAWLFIL